MAVTYKKLWHILIDRNLKKKDLDGGSPLRELPWGRTAVISAADVASFSP